MSVNHVVDVGAGASVLIPAVLTDVNGHNLSLAAFGWSAIADGTRPTSGTTWASITPVDFSTGFDVVSFLVPIGSGVTAGKKRVVFKIAIDQQVEFAIADGTITVY